ncbi:hypothetical protein QBC45DRAFT_86061 [Copromyces sp. CBS 386.78]|nr:hypothetical protein QBC45DRAFT_86061 [Copromyces sp. CBS 386.78]
MSQKTLFLRQFLLKITLSVFSLLRSFIQKSNAASCSTSTTTTKAPWPTLLDLIFWEDYGDASLCNQPSQAFIRCPDMSQNICCGVLPPFCGALACNRTQGCGEGTGLSLLPVTEIARHLELGQDPMAVDSFRKAMEQTVACLAGAVMIGILTRPV